jgi:pimeloyl-ACP methyl ester carboxylesterase
MVGHSMGNGEITRYLTRHGDARVARVVMCAPSLPFGLKTPDNPDGPNDPAVVAGWHDTWATNWVEWISGAVVGAYGDGASPDRVQATVRAMLQTSPWAAIKLNAANVHTDFRDELRRLAMPTLVLHGDADQSTPLAATGAKLPALMPNCRLKVYPGCDHTFIGGSARQIMDDVLAFIAEAAEVKAA